MALARPPLAVILLPSLFPFLLCSQRFCGFWYVRPELPPTDPP